MSVHYVISHEMGPPNRGVFCPRVHQASGGAALLMAMTIWLLAQNSLRQICSWTIAWPGRIIHDFLNGPNLIYWQRFSFPTGQCSAPLCTSDSTTGALCGAAVYCYCQFINSPPFHQKRICCHCLAIENDIELDSFQ